MMGILEESILNTIKDMLGVSKDDFSFDTDIIVHINTALMTLQQYGISQEEGFRITDASQTWGEFLPEEKKVDAAKTYVWLKVKMIFDPPQNSFVMSAYEEQAKELEYRIKEQIEANPGEIPKSEVVGVSDEQLLQWEIQDEEDEIEFRNSMLEANGNSHGGDS